MLSREDIINEYYKLYPIGANNFWDDFRDGAVYVNIVQACIKLHESRYPDQNAREQLIDYIDALNQISLNSCRCIADEKAPCKLCAELGRDSVRRALKVLRKHGFPY